MTATFKGGHYSIAKIFGWTIAEHTYVGADSGGAQTTWFDCYGGHSGDDNVYPDPATVADGDLRLAKTICCLDPNDNRTDFDKRLGGRLVLGDCCGIIYGVMGVCFNMANRILYATDKAPVINPAGSAIIYPLYGLYGTPLGTSNPLFTALELVLKQFGVKIPDTFNFAAYLALCKLVMQGAPAANVTLSSILNAVTTEMTTFAEATRHEALLLEIREADSLDLPAKRLQLTIANRLGVDFDAGKSAELVGQINELASVKTELDRAFYEGTISLVKHASILNTAVSKVLTRFEPLLTGDQHNELLGFAPGEHFTLVDPDIAAEVQQTLQNQP